ncbi:MAG: hypothetical protein IJ848_00830 [Alphaproteobacteria bacterium]|nr:hypothetical protein [Alphaproteobacteria bacterium]
MINKISLLTIIALISSNILITNIFAGYGVGISVGFVQNTVYCNGEDKLYAALLNKLKSAIAATQKKFEVPNTSDTEMIDKGKYVTIDCYSADGNDPSKIAGATDPKKLSSQKTTLKIKRKEFKSNNPTMLTLIEDNTWKYNGNFKDNNGEYINRIIPVNKNVLSENNITLEENPNTHVFDNNSTDATKTANYLTLNKDGTTYYITPHDFVFLYKMDTDGNPTHLSLSQLNDTDPITYSFLKDIISDKNTSSYYKEIIDSKDNVIEYDETNNKITSCYINTVKHKDLGLSDNFVEDAALTLNQNSKWFYDVSKQGIELGLVAFRQFNIFNRLFVRTGAFGNLPVLNNTVYASDKDNKSSANTNDGLSLSRSCELGLQLLSGINITQNFALIGGVEFGYARYKLNNIDKLTANSNKLINWVKAGDSDAVNTLLQDFGLSSDTKEKIFNKFFCRGLLGCEYSFGKFAFGLQLFGGKMTLMKNNPFNLIVLNAGIRITSTYTL